MTLNPICFKTAKRRPVVVKFIVTKSLRKRDFVYRLVSVSTFLFRWRFIHFTSLLVKQRYIVFNCLILKSSALSHLHWLFHFAISFSLVQKISAGTCGKLESRPVHDVVHVKMKQQTIVPLDLEHRKQHCVCYWWWIRPSVYFGAAERLQKNWREAAGAC